MYFSTLSLPPVNSSKSILNDSSDDMTPLEPDSPHWDHSYDALFYKFPPEAVEKFKKQYEEFKEKSAGGTGRSCPWRR